KNRETAGMRKLLIIWWIILGAAFACLVFMFFFWGGRGGVRSVISRAKVDMRSLATALEFYAVDNGSYPTERPLVGFPTESWRAIKLDSRSASTLFTIEPGRGDSLH